MRDASAEWSPHLRLAIDSKPSVRPLSCFCRVSRLAFIHCLVLLQLSQSKARRKLYLPKVDHLAKGSEYQRTILGTTRPMWGKLGRVLSNKLGKVGVPGRKNQRLLQRYPDLASTPASNQQQQRSDQATWKMYVTAMPSQENRTSVSTSNVGVVSGESVHAHCRQHHARLCFRSRPSR